MIARRYNIVTNKYSEATIPNCWNVVTNAEDDATINCIHCGQQIFFKKSSESKRYEDEHGRGYRECSICYNNFLPLAKFKDK